MKIITDNIIKTIKTTLPRMFVCSKHIDITVTTHIHEQLIKPFWGTPKKKYTIEQFKPLISNPHFDGEFTTNEIISITAKEQYAQAKEFINCYKNGKLWLP